MKSFLLSLKTKSDLIDNLTRISKEPVSLKGKDTEPQKLMLTVTKLGHQENAGL
jgi:hypothetical protein